MRKRWIVVQATCCMLTVFFCLYLVFPELLRPEREGSECTYAGIPRLRPAESVESKPVDPPRQDHENSLLGPIPTLVRSPVTTWQKASPTQLHLELHEMDDGVATWLPDRLHRVLADLHVTALRTNVVTYEENGASATAILQEAGHVTLHTFGRTLVMDVFLADQPQRDWEADASRIASGMYGKEVKNMSPSSFTYSVMSLSKTSDETSNDKQTELTVPEQSKEDVVPTDASSTRILETIDTPTGTIQVAETTQQHYRDTDVPWITDRELLLDGEWVINQSEQAQYYESMVHPAFIASSLPPKRVLIVGGGTGGALRETLKYEAVEQVVVLYPDAGLRQMAHTWIPDLQNCTGFGADNCFDDPRVTVVEELDFWGWFYDETHGAGFGRDICRERSKYTEKKFDIVLLDNPIDEEMWEEDNDAFWHLSCAVSRFGVFQASVGEAPEPSFSQSLQVKQPTGRSQRQEMNALVEEYSERIRWIQETLTNFRHERVYDIPLVDRHWAFAMGMVPWQGNLRDDFELQRGVFDGRSSGGANDFDDRPALVNIQLRRKLKLGIRLAYYDGVVQNAFRYPQADWHGVYCLDEEHKDECNFANMLTRDYEEEIMDIRLDPDHNGHSGALAKVDIPKGTITGLWDAASDVDLPGSKYFRSKGLAREFETQFNDFKAWVQIYGYDGGRSGTGERIMISYNSYHTFLNHACDHNPNLENFEEYAPELSHKLFRRWNPIALRYLGELDHFKVATRDIKKGELLYDDYSRWDGFVQSENGLQDKSRFDLWCNNSTT